MDGSAKIIEQIAVCMQTKDNPIISTQKRFLLLHTNISCLCLHAYGILFLSSDFWHFRPYIIFTLGYIMCWCGSLIVGAWSIAVLLFQFLNYCYYNAWQCGASICAS